MSTLMQEFFDQRAEQWDSRVHNDHDRIAAILRLTGLKKGKKVLDIGCGTGVLVPHILPYEPADYQAIDVSEKMIALARRKAEGKPVRFHCADVMEFAETGFDWAIVFNAYPHILEPEKLAAALRRILTGDGRMVIAHDHSRQVINHRHSGPANHHTISRTLQSAAEEAAAFAPYFTIDILADTPDCYILSGLVKS